MPEIFKKQIVKLLKHDDYLPQKLPHLAKTLGVGSDDYPQFKEAFDQLRQAGHVVIGSFIVLIFLLGWVVVPLSVGFVLFVDLLELVIAFIQAYIFTMLTANFIGMSVEPAH